MHWKEMRTERKIQKHQRYGTTEGKEALKKTESDLFRDEK